MDLRKKQSKLTPNPNLKNLIMYSDFNHLWGLLSGAGMWAHISRVKASKGLKSK